MKELATLDLAKRLRDILVHRRLRIVFAESCTAGRVAATLAILPGASQWLCGSWVVYRNASKCDWLGIPGELLDDPHIGPVSPEASQRLAQAALARTLEAQVAVAVTGDVGPGAPPALDGRLFLAMQHGHLFSAAQASLQAAAPQHTDDTPARLRRLEEATTQVLQFAIRQLS